MEISKQQFKEAYGKLPETIRFFLASDELSHAVKAIAPKYGLHIDVAGKLEEVLSQTLMGFISPAQLPSILASELGIQPSQVALLIGEINTVVFIPLRDRVRNQPAEEQHTESSVQTSQNIILPVEPPKMSAPRVEAPTVLHPDSSTSVSTVNAFNQQTVGNTFETPLPVVPVRTMATDLDALQHHQQPVPQYFVPAQQNPHAAGQNWQAAASVHVFVPGPQQVPPTPVQHTQAAPVTATLPVESPASGSMLPQPLPPTSTQSVLPATPLTKEYSADPYREPV